MPPELAAVVFAIVVVGLFAFDRDREARTSKALWIPVVWISLAASRSVSQWLGFGSAIQAVEQATEGNSLDAAIQLALMAAGAIVLHGRGREVRTLLRDNRPIVIFFSYCALSVLWSDYPIVAFKRWTKDVGDLIMVLIVLTEHSRPAAIRHLFARFGFVLVPASILLIKYYTAVGVAWTRGGDVVRYNGVAVDKNMLGVVCLIAGLGCVWRLVEALRSGNGLRKTRPLIAQVTLLVMVFWLFAKADSMTSLAGFAMASSVMVATSLPALSRNRTSVHLLVVSVLFTAFAIVFLDLGGADLKGELGRDATLTDRTWLWEKLLDMNRDPLFGTGFESFWLGERLVHLWALFWWRPNEAHNAYIEVFLNLGWMGITLLAIVIATGYRSIVGALHRDPNLGRLRVALFVAAIVYSFTEAAFRVMNPVWLVFLLAIMAAPNTQQQEVRSDALALA